MKYILLSLFLLVFLNADLKSQENSALSTFETAQQLATEKQFDKAIIILNKLLATEPQNTDYQIYLGRLYSWNGDYDKALKVLEPLTLTSSPNPEALEALTNTQLWKPDYPSVLSLCEKGLRSNFSRPFYLHTKAYALILLKRTDEASLVIKELLISEPNHVGGNALRTLLYQSQRNGISVSYLNTSFNQSIFNPRHLGFVEYKRNTKYFPIIARLNYGYANPNQAAQMEIDAYPKLGNKSYLYLNAGGSGKNNIFPVFNLASEYFSAFGNGWDYSAGARYLHFSITEVLIFTGHIGFQKNTYDFSLRPYASLTNQKLATSNVFSIKKSNELKERFIQLEFQYGTMPYSFSLSDEFARLSATRVGLHYQFRAFKDVLFRPIIMTEYEEYAPNAFRYRFNTQLIITKRF